MAGIARHRSGREVRFPNRPGCAGAIGTQPECRPLRHWGTLLAGLTIVALSGCTIVEITDPEGAARIERRAGFTAINVQPTRAPVVAHLRSFGIASTPLGFTAGYGAHQLALLGEDCRVVFWIDSEQQLRSLERLAATLSEVCIINPNQGDDQ
jgi:hypothetical protein